VATQPTQENVEEKTTEVLARSVDLQFSYDGVPCLKDITLEVPAGARVILIGSNGAGKSTLLRLLAGKHLVPRTVDFDVLGRRAPQDQIDGLAFLGNNWQRTVSFAGNGVSFQADIPVKQMSKSTQDKYPERRDRLYELLEINPDWRMHKVSDGQRRRVQIMLSLLRPFKLLLLDEMTVDLDVLARAELLHFLKQETEIRGASVVYTTHIFDGLDGWGTHLFQVSEGSLKIAQTIDSIEPLTQLRTTPGVVSPLLLYVHSLLFAEREERRNAGKATFEREEFAQTADMKDDHQQGGWSSGRFYNYW
jgi:CCR4-NOT complex subunit CAF16